MSNCKHEFAEIEDNDYFLECTKCKVWIRIDEFPLYEAKQRIKELEKERDSLNHSWECDQLKIKLLRNDKKQLEKQLQEAREENNKLKQCLNEIRNRRGNTMSSDLLEKMLKLKEEQK